jgi:pantothenate synthetase
MPLTSSHRAIQNQVLLVPTFGSLFSGHLLLPLRLIETSEVNRGNELWHKT